MLNIQAQTREESTPTFPALATLGLPPSTFADLQQTIAAHNYVAAEKILLAELARNPQSPSASHLLAFAGTVYFLNHDYWNAAVAWKKSDAITPLDSSLRFTLAMAYIRIAHSDWAQTELESLARQYPQDALFPYWLGRISYDNHRYEEAIRFFQHAIQLNPSMARAYDNLGLCFYYQNQNELAIANYNKAIELDRNAPHPSPWPYLNLAITQQFLNQLSAAQTSLRHVLQLDPALAPAHFRLGTVLEELGQSDNAVIELREAIRLDPSSPEPHIVLARLFHKLGQAKNAQNEVGIYRQLRANAASH